MEKVFEPFTDKEVFKALMGFSHDKNNFVKSLIATFLVLIPPPTKKKKKQNRG